MESAQDGDRNCADPNYPFSEEELNDIRAGDKKAGDLVPDLLENMPTLGKPSADDLGFLPEPPENDWYYRVVPPGPDGHYREPGALEYRNYCGPGATMIALHGMLRDTTRVRNDDWFFYDIGEEENIDPNQGIYIHRARPVLNSHPAQRSYVYGGASGSLDVFRNRIVNSIWNGFCVVTGLRTGGMPGWPYDTNHIVTIYGYAYHVPTGALRVYWVDTANIANTRYSGPYRNGAGLPTLWDYASRNDAQVYWAGA